MTGGAPGTTPTFSPVATALRWLGFALSWRFAAFWVILAVNIALGSLYLWSRDGAATDVRIEVTGPRYRVFVDERLVAQATLQARSEGGIGFRLARDDFVPSLPKPTGIDSVRISDAASGEVIFEDEFRGSLSDEWTVEGGRWQTHGGVLSTATGGVVTTGPRPWQDYVVEAKLRNVPEATIYLRMENSRNAVAFKMRPFRHYDASITVLENGRRVESQPGGGLHLDRGQTIRSITRMLLRPYPTLLLMVLGAVLVGGVVRLAPLEAWLLAAGRFVLRRANLVILTIAGATVVLLWYLNYVVGDAMPHVPDSVAYIFQAKIFASLRATADAPPVRESFAIFRPHMLQVVDGRWFTHYPFGHPLVLAMGLRAGAVWLVPPLVGAASAYLIYRVGHHVYGAAVGLLAAVLLFFSPFFQMTASNFMSHNTAAFYLLASLFFFVRPTKRRPLSMFLGGVFLGLLFNTRPLTAVTYIPILGLFMAYELLRAGFTRRQLFREYLFFAAGGLLLLIAYFLYNQATTGSFTQSQYALQGTYSADTFGFGGRHSVAIGLQNQQELLAFLILVAHGWPVAIGLALSALPFVLGSRTRWDYLFAASGLAIAGTAIYYVNAAVMHGPRFWYESLPFLVLLSARGAHLLIEAGSSGGRWLVGRIRGGTPAPTYGVTALAVYGLIAALIAFSAYGWMLGQRDAWKGIDFVPQKMSLLEGFNAVDDRLLDEADEMDLENALVLVQHCPNWQCFGSVFWDNSPDLDSDVVWAEEQGTVDDLRLLDEFRGRSLYRATHFTGKIVPVTEAAIAGSVQEAAPTVNIERAKKSAGSARDRDQVRRQDIETLRKAVERYAEENGSYPDNRGQVQTICVYRTLDAGCALKTVLPVIPHDPLGDPGSNGYWYASDGKTYYLFAKQEEMEVDESQCPENLPHLGRAKAVYCVRGGEQ